MQAPVVNRVRFTPDDDLALLREVLNLYPLENVEKWLNVQTSMENLTGKKFTIRTLKDHLKLLLDIFLKKDKINSIRSGVEEVYSERDHLLQKIGDICKEAGIKKKKGPSKEEKIIQIGKQNRELHAIQHFMEAETLSEMPVQSVQLNAIDVSTESPEHNMFSKVESNIFPQVQIPGEIIVISETPNTSEEIRPAETIRKASDIYERNKNAAMGPMEKKVEAIIHLVGIDSKDPHYTCKSQLETRMGGSKKFQTNSTFFTRKIYLFREF